jgi:hypothetical protein
LARQTTSPGKLQFVAVLHKDVRGSGGGRQLHTFSNSELDVKLSATLEGALGCVGVREQGAEGDWPRRDEVTGEWRKLHEELYDLYCSPNIVRVIK